MIVNLANAAALVLVLYITGQFTNSIIIWSLVIGLFSFRTLLQSLRQRQKAPPETVSQRAVHKVVRSSAIFGLIWTYPSMFVLPLADGGAQVFVAALITGMICGGAITLYPIPLAAIAYSGPVTAGGLIGMSLAANPVAIGLTIIAASFFFIFFQVIQRHAQLFVSEFVARLDLEESHKSIAKLIAETKSEASQEKRRSEKRLAEAQKMEAIGQLTGGIAHDFNNLLAVIQGNAELLEELELSDDTKPMATAIVHASQRGAELTQRLLAYSRKQPLRPEVIDTQKLLSDMSDVLQRMLGETILVSTRTQDDCWTALADPGQVEAALLNLAINARDAMPQGGEVIVECTNVTLDEDSSIDGSEVTAGDYVVLSVTDHGIGMSKDIRERAFEPFFTTKGVGKGSGLGLSMVYGFAQQSGGQATIYSEEGQGTTVKLYLPRAQSESKNSAKPQKEAVPRGQGETILVIEDDPAVRDLAEMMLRNLGYDVICAENANDARHSVSGYNDITLVLSDVVLPGGMSGPEFAEELKINHPNIKVIFMSGYPAEAARKNGFLGSDSVLLNKPFRVAQLAKAVQEALG